MASSTRALSTLAMRKRSATTSSTFLRVSPVEMGSEPDFVLLFFAPESPRPESGSDPISTSTSRSAWTRVKPLAESHWVTSSALVLAGSSTGKVRTSRGSPDAAARRSSSAYTVSGVSCCTGSAVVLSNRLPARENRSLRWSFSSVMVPTVERLERTGLVWSMAMAGGTPSTLSTAGLSMRSRNWRA